MKNGRPALTVVRIGMLYVCLAGLPKGAGAQGQTQVQTNADARIQAQSQVQMNMDAQADFKRTDKALTIVFNHVAQKLPFLTRKKLEAAEKAWAVYRDAQANFSASIEAEGGSLYPTAFNDARTNLTRQRIKLLKKISSNGTP